MPPFIQSFYAFLVGTALAANTPTPSPSAPLIGPGATTTTGITSDIPRTFSSFASETLQIVTLLAGILAVFYLIYAGMQYIASSGNADRVKTARAGIVNAVIGIVVIVAAYFIIRIAVIIGSEANNSTAESSDTPRPLVTDVPEDTK